MGWERIGELTGDLTGDRSGDSGAGWTGDLAVKLREAGTLTGGVKGTATGTGGEQAGEGSQTGRGVRSSGLLMTREGEGAIPSACSSSGMNGSGKKRPPRGFIRGIWAERGGGGGGGISCSNITPLRISGCQLTCVPSSGGSAGERTASSLGIWLMIDSSEKNKRN